MKKKLLKKKAIVIGAGGTGGHLFPALAIAKALIKINNNLEIIFAVTKKSEKEMVEKNFKVIVISSASFDFKNLLKAFAGVFKLFKGFTQSIILLAQNNISAVLVTGGYATFPMALAAVFLNKKLFLQEPNSVPGKTSLFFQKFALKIFTAFPKSEKYFKYQEKTMLLGNPIREINEFSDAELAEKLRNCGKKKILVFGGSQGAEKINDMLVESLELFSENILIIHLTGQDKYAEVKSRIEKIQKIKPEYIILPFAENILSIIQDVDLIVGRSGAGTCTELAYLGKPSVLIPYPFATDNHQAENAKYLTDKNAAKLILDKDLTAEEFYKTVTLLLQDENQLKQMSLNAKSLSFNNSAKKIAEEILKVIH